ncbi:coproporphyrinogen dehydrogenase HemZ [Thermincola potens]|uniref:Coproporphyrinogen dehydrogenase n=1 Tax=Thermincola potens (strain JR) TaxID=635013 RepID=D5X855_THEPJ|nr:coproporphyrinogen dehydrogenase HemZ [Thermincola potens]ADG82775.1 Coproporphyrinogen dehydrogenase [Thermincola potens JR]
MKVRIDAEKGFDRVCHDILRALLGPVEFVAPGFLSQADLDISITATSGRKLFAGATAVKGGSRDMECIKEDVLIAGEAHNQLKRMVKQAVYRSVLKVCGLKPLPYGILTGIRPTKIVHRLLDMGWDKETIREHLLKSYDMDEVKAEGLLKVALNNRKYILGPEEAEQTVSLYVGIPFCPTRCAYCSFPAYPVSKYAGMIAPFVVALKKEIAGIAGFLRAEGWQVQTIYLGGGTPTALEEKILSELLESLDKAIPFTTVREITLEAGRPDTLTREKLAVSRKLGVTRLSINPQSMNPRTLNNIGRLHTPEDIESAFKMARQAGFNNINMDIIIGLPGETAPDVENTLLKIEPLAPENLTVHTLAVKRASQIRENRERYELPEETEITKMLAITEEYTEKWGMHPYYLYRQKYMVGPTENRGYAVEGYDCIYNIQVIEERQTIIGLGAGAGSKFVNPADWTLTNLYNPKDPEAYINRVDELLEKKISRLEQVKNKYQAREGK